MIFMQGFSLRLINYFIASVIKRQAVYVTPYTTGIIYYTNAGNLHSFWIIIHTSWHQENYLHFNARCIKNLCIQANVSNFILLSNSILFYLSLSKDVRTKSRVIRRLPFQLPWEVAPPFPWLLQFTLNPHLIILSAKQGRLKYHFLTPGLLDHWRTLYSVFTDGLGNQGSIPARVIPKTQKSFLMPPCLALSIIRWGSRGKLSNPGNRVEPFPSPRCSCYWKGGLQVTLD